MSRKKTLGFKGKRYIYVKKMDVCALLIMMRKRFGNLPVLEEIEKSVDRLPDYQ